MLFFSFTVKVLTTLSKTTEGRVSNWHFCQDGDKYFALRTSPAVKVLGAKNQDDLRRLYRKYVSYGFTKV